MEGHARAADEERDPGDRGQDDPPVHDELVDLAPDAQDLLTDVLDLEIGDAPVAASHEGLRLALRVLVPARRFTDEHDTGLRMALSRYGVGALRTEITPAALPHFGRDGLQGIGRVRRSRGLDRGLCAGLRLLMMNCGVSSAKGMMSIFSPFSSRVMACTREPLRPTHAPTGSTSRSLEKTATLARSPGSRTHFLITTVPS